MKLLPLLFLSLFLSCSNIQNGEIWQVNSRKSVEVHNYSDSTYAEKKHEESSPIDQKNPVTFLLSGSIFLYQEMLSSQDGNSCGFRPSCSHYAATSVKEYNVLGIFMSADRLLRCNPYAFDSYNRIEGSYYRYDPVDKNKTP